MAFGRDRGRGGFGGGRGGFSRGGGRSFGGGFNRGGDRGRREMFDATCSKCGKECQVPFKPTGNKPVLCSDCFGKNGNGSSGGNNSGQLDEINRKLDKIIAILADLELETDDMLADEEIEDENVHEHSHSHAEESEDDMEDEEDNTPTHIVETEDEEENY